MPKQRGLANPPIRVVPRELDMSPAAVEARTKLLQELIDKAIVPTLVERWLREQKKP